MAKLPVTSARKVLRALSRLGFHEVRQRGSHIVLVNEETRREVVVPNHPELDRGTLKSILKQAGISVDQLLEVLVLLR